MLPTLCTQITLFIPILFLENNTHDNTAIDNTNIIHNILTIRINVNYFQFFLNLPMKVREWRPMLDTKYKMKQCTIQAGNVHENETTSQ